MFCECHDIVVNLGPAAVLDIGLLRVPSGRITAIVGPNGSGKTTLLEVMSLLHRPTRGRLRLWGQAVTGGRCELRRDVVMVMHPGYLFRGSVRDNVMFALKARGIRRKQARSRAAEAMAMVGLSHLAHRHVADLSAGERQRANLARALAAAPRALLLDEPTANVDKDTIDLVREVLLRLRDQHAATIVHTSPANNGLLDISEVVVELARGKVRHAHGPSRGGCGIDSGLSGAGGGQEC